MLGKEEYQFVKSNYINWVRRRHVIFDMLDGNIVVNEFKLHSRLNVHFQQWSK